MMPRKAEIELLDAGWSHAHRKQQVNAGVFDKMHEGSELELHEAELSCASHLLCATFK